MNRLFLLVFLIGMAGCGGSSATTTGESLMDARAAHNTVLTQHGNAGQPVDVPPAGVFLQTTYPAQSGELACYVTPDPKDGKRHPAIIWITGGDCNTIGDVWSPQSRDNDQTAAQFRNAGIVMMFPSLRGGNTNPGSREGFYGEVDDVEAAAAQLAMASYVDPKRIYLGGHSTGGTLVMLCAASSDRYRAVFSLGPADDIAGYGSDFAPMVKLHDSTEVKLRSPIHWLHSIQSPTFVFEGTSQGNLNSLNKMKRRNKNPLAKFYPVSGHTHFSLIAPLSELLAQKILADTGETTNITITDDEMNRLPH